MMRLLINIEFAHSPAWIIPCVLLGILAAVFLYSSKRHFPELSNWKRWLMAILRGTAISLILLLLLNPLIKQLKTQVERRQVVILQDQSQSIAEASDSEQLISFDKALTQLLGHVSVEADTHRLYFSDVVNNAKSKDYEGKLTNISDALEYVW